MFKEISQAAIYRLEGMRMELENMISRDFHLFKENHFWVGIALNFLRQWELYNKI